MGKSFRRSLSIILATALLITSCPINVFADEEANLPIEEATVSLEGTTGEIPNEVQNDSESILGTLIESKDNDEELREASNSDASYEEISIEEKEQISEATPSEAECFDCTSEEIDGIKVRVTADEGVFPTGSQLVVKKVAKSNEDAKDIEAAIDNAKLLEEDEEKKEAETYIFDIKVVDKDGNELQPKDGAEVKVSFEKVDNTNALIEAKVYHLEKTDENKIEELEELVKKANEADDEDDFDYSLLDGEVIDNVTEGHKRIKDKTAEIISKKENAVNGEIEDELELKDTSFEAVELNAEIKEETDIVETTTEGFSYYVVEFYYGVYEYVLDGDSEVALSIILEALGLKDVIDEAKITKIEVSDNTLFVPVHKETKTSSNEFVWYIKALKAFDTEEKMTITVDGKKFEIKVTDSNTSVSTLSALKDAIKNASGATTITLSKDITFGSYDTPICITGSKDITIDLNSNTIDADGSGDLIFKISTSDSGKPTVTIKNGTLANAGDMSLYFDPTDIFSSITGGAIDNRATLALDNVYICGCFADLGGAIFNAGTLTMNNVVIDSCMACAGGAVFNCGNLTIKGTGMTESEIKAKKTLTGAVIANCMANVGGAIVNANINKKSGEGSLDIYGGTIYGCEATIDEYLMGCLEGAGGAIMNGAVFGSYEIEGELYPYGGTTHIYGGDIFSCTSDCAAGGIFNCDSVTVDSGTINNCETGSFGGGIANMDYLKINGGTISNCTAGNSTSYGLGGGIVNLGVLADVNPKIEYTAGTIKDCSVTGDSSCGGAIYSGAYYFDRSLNFVLNIKNVIISDCLAAYNGGAIYIAEDNAKIEKSNISGCIATSGAGIYNCGSINVDETNIASCEATSAGGGIASEGELNISDSEITSCEAEEFGAGIYSEADLIIIGTDITSCTTDAYGGGVCIVDGEVIAEDITINDCWADIGAGIYNEGELDIDGASITECGALSGGGGIYSEGSLTITKGTITDNEDDDINTSGDLKITGGTIGTISGDYKRLDFNSNGGSAVAAAKIGTSTYPSILLWKTTVSSPQTSKTGYKFNGWYNNNEQYDFTKIAETTGTVTLKAKFGAKSYKVTLNAKGGTGGTSSVDAVFDSAMPSITCPSKTGYTFGGYFTGTEGSGTMYYSADGSGATTWNIPAATTLYAKWVANTYTVKFDSQSATKSGTTSIEATYDSDMPEITLPEKTGHIFGGYFTGTNGTGTKYYNANGTSAKKWAGTETTTLYAKWTLSSYTVTLDGNGATTAGTTSVIATYNTAMPSIEKLPSKAGFVFDGFYDGKEESAIQYYDANGVGTRSWDKTSNTTLYAKWKKSTADAIIDGKEITGTLVDILDEVESGQTVKLLNPVNNPTETITVKEGVSLDVAGNTLVVEDILLFGSLEDTSNGNGAIKLKGEKLVAAGNPYMPIYDSSISDDGTNGYRLYKYAVKLSAADPAANKTNYFKLKYRLYLYNCDGTTQSEKAYNLLADVDTKLLLSTCLSLPDSSGKISKHEYNYTDSSTKAYGTLKAADTSKEIIFYLSIQNYKKHAGKIIKVSSTWNVDGGKTYDARTTDKYYKINSDGTVSVSSEEEFIKQEKK